MSFNFGRKYENAINKIIATTTLTRRDTRNLLVLSAVPSSGRAVVGFTVVLLGERMFSMAGKRNACSTLPALPVKPTRGTGVYITQHAFGEPFVWNRGLGRRNWKCGAGLNFGGGRGRGAENGDDGSMMMCEWLCCNQILKLFYLRVWLISIFLVINKGTGFDVKTISQDSGNTAKILEKIFHHSCKVTPPKAGNHTALIWFQAIINNYSPKWRWIAVDIYRAASAR